MKLTILLAGENPEPLRAEFGRYADKFVRMFGGENPEFTFQTIAVHAGEPIPPVRELEGVIVSGSAFGAYDSPPWMDPLRAFIRAAYKGNLPMLGICFGHQIIADALGGKVIKSEKGWSIGRHIYRLNDCPECFLAGPTQLAIAASHQDQVVVVPEKARVFLSSDFTPNAGLIYDNGVTISMQPHPEFEIDYSKAICNLRRDNPLDNESVDSAVASLDQPLDNEQVANALTGFFLRSAKATGR
ncbi:MAG TPA: type 1 glutamine amidotransferase [Devosia sp.]|nr:type 1 glutamine amidotransferase [Devosia sp.]